MNGIKKTRISNKHMKKINHTPKKLAPIFLNLVAWKMLPKSPGFLGEPPPTSPPQVEGEWGNKDELLGSKSGWKPLQQQLPPVKPIGGHL